MIAALAGLPELGQIKRDYHLAFVEKCRGLLAPFAANGSIASPGLWVMLRAAEALSNAATGEIAPKEAKDELFQTIIPLVN